MEKKMIMNYKKNLMKLGMKKTELNFGMHVN